MPALGSLKPRRLTGCFWPTACVGRRFVLSHQVKEHVPRAIAAAVFDHDDRAAGRSFASSACDARDVLREHRFFVVSRENVDELAHFDAESNSEPQKSSLGHEPRSTAGLLFVRDRARVEMHHPLEVGELVPIARTALAVSLRVRTHQALGDHARAAPNHRSTIAPSARGLRFRSDQGW